MANATTPPAPNSVRPPSPVELRQVWQWLKDSDKAEMYGLEEATWLNRFWIAVFDDYITDCPGYAGKVLYLVWGGYPQACDVFTWDKDGIVLEGSHGDCCCDTRPLWNAAPEMHRLLKSLVDSWEGEDGGHNLNYEQACIAILERIEKE